MPTASRGALLLLLASLSLADAFANPVELVLHVLDGGGGGEKFDKSISQ
jgi:hypothetical protein